MFGLTVRWSLTAAPETVMAELRDYVEHQSYPKFAGLDGLQFKTWRAVEGQWFEGCYVFSDDAERATFQAGFAKVAAESAGSKIVGSAPILIEPCEIVAVVQGTEGFRASPTFEN